MHLRQTTAESQIITMAAKLMTSFAVIQRSDIRVVFRVLRTWSHSPLASKAIRGGMVYSMFPQLKKNFADTRLAKGAGTIGFLTLSKYNVIVNQL